MCQHEDGSKWESLLLPSQQTGNRQSQQSLLPSELHQIQGLHLHHQFQRVISTLAWALRAWPWAVRDGSWWPYSFELCNLTRLESAEGKYQCINILLAYELGWMKLSSEEATRDYHLIFDFLGLSEIGSGHIKPIQKGGILWFFVRSSLSRVMVNLKSWMIITWLHNWGVVVTSIRRGCWLATTLVFLQRSLQFSPTQQRVVGSLFSSPLLLAYSGLFCMRLCRTRVPTIICSPYSTTRSRQSFLSIIPSPYNVFRSCMETGNCSRPQGTP